MAPDLASCSSSAFDRLRVEDLLWESFVARSDRGVEGLHGGSLRL